MANLIMTNEINELLEKLGVEINQKKQDAVAEWYLPLARAEISKPVSASTNKQSTLLPEAKCTQCIYRPCRNCKENNNFIYG